MRGSPFPAEAQEEVYGHCRNDAGDALYAFTTDKSGLIVQYKFEESREAASLRLVRRLRVDTQPEGCVVDDANHALYVCEEDIGIWRFDARKAGQTAGVLITQTGPEGELVADVEGLAIYDGGEADDGHLVASSQGDNSYVVFDRAPPHAFRGRFQIRYSGQVIGDTDGIEVTSAALGSAYPSGVIAVQNGMIRDSQGNRRYQRFVIASWAEVEEALGS